MDLKYFNAGFKITCYNTVKFSALHAKYYTDQMMPC